MSIHLNQRLFETVSTKTQHYSLHEGVCLSVNVLII